MSKISTMNICTLNRTDELAQNAMKKGNEIAHFFRYFNFSDGSSEIYGICSI